MPRAENFIETLRSEGNYPAFRNIVNIGFWLVQAMAAIALVGAVVALFKGSWAAFFGGLVSAIVLHILGRVAKEASHMMADLSDATVRMAERGARD